MSFQNFDEHRRPVQQYPTKAQLWTQIFPTSYKCTRNPTLRIREVRPNELTFEVFYPQKMPDEYILNKEVHLIVKPVLNQLFGLPPITLVNVCVTSVSGKKVISLPPYEFRWTNPVPSPEPSTFLSRFDIHVLNKYWKLMHSAFEEEKKISLRIAAIQPANNTLFIELVVRYGGVPSPVIEQLYKESLNRLLEVIPPELTIIKCYAHVFFHPDRARYIGADNPSFDVLVVGSPGHVFSQQSYKDYIHFFRFYHEAQIDYRFAIKDYIEHVHNDLYLEEFDIVDIDNDVILFELKQQVKAVRKQTLSRYRRLGNSFI